jgi:hypothetical protein
VVRQDLAAHQMVLVRIQMALQIQAAVAAVMVALRVSGAVVTVVLELLLLLIHRDTLI